MAKRALIVDDSRSARVILSRMLEGYGLQVETCESAEQSLTYLNNQRPDVIFMDHLMPGMDGFQAVQAIKTNPATAMIPVIMYTSQEGELYASQARALGAVGVLPKTVKQSDVQRVLYQLRLLPDRRDAREPVLEPIELGALSGVTNTATPPPRAPVVAPAPASVQASAPAPADLEAAIRQAIAPMLKEHHNELRRWITSVLDSLGYREAASAGENTVVQLDAAPPSAPARDDITVPRPWAYALVGAAALSLAALVVLGVMYARAIDSTPAVQTAATETSSAAITSGPASDHSIDVTSPLSDDTLTTSDLPIALHQIQIESVPYGEVPLAGARVERLRQLLSVLREQGMSGTIQATTYIGDFCLSGNAVEGYAPADAELPARKCDVIGNPFEDNLRGAQRESLAFANLIGSLAQAGGDVEVDVTHAGRKPIAAYPENPPPEKMTAGEWNGVAERNNRVEFAFQPDTSPVARTTAE